MINFSAKGSSVSKGETLKDTALTLEAMGADAVVIRHRASGAPHRLATRAGSGPAWSTPATAPTSTRPRRCSTPSRCAATSAALDGLAGRRSSATSCTRRVARSNVLLLRPSAPRSPWSPRPRCCRSASRLAGARSSYDLDAVLPEGRRGDDAAGPARADERRRSSRRCASTAAATGWTAGGWRRCRTTRSSCTPARWSAAWRSPPTSRTARARSIVEQVTNGVAVRMAVLYLLLGGSERRAERAACD